MPIEQGSSLPADTMEFVERIVRRSAWRRRVRDEVRRELRAHFEDALEHVPEAERAEAAKQIASDFGETAVLARLINRGKKRCRPLWERMLWHSLTALVVFMLATLATAWVAGKWADIACRQTVARMRQEGGLRDVSQLHSTRPKDTVYFNGPDHDSATALLTAMKPVVSAVKEKTPNRLEYQFFNSAEDLEVDAEKEQMLRTIVTAHAQQLELLRHIAELPSTPLDQVVRVAHLTDWLLVKFSCRGAIDGARSMLVNAYLLHRDGRDDEALRECSHVMDIAAHFRDVPVVISQVAAIALEKDMARVLIPISLSASLSPECALQFGRDWDPSWNREALAQAIEFEGGRACWAINDSRMPMTAIVGPEKSNWKRSFISAQFHATLLRAITAPDELEFYRHYTGVAKCARKPYYEVKEMAAAYGTHHETQTSSGLNILRAFTLNYLLDSALAETRVSQARTALALSAYKNGKNSYPEKLDALLPAFLASVPLDPFSGKPMAYALRGDKYVLYSVGPNGLDDTSGSGKPDNSDDIAWGGISRFD